MKTFKKTRKKKATNSNSIEFKPFSNPLLKDSNGVIETLLTCIREGDVDSFRDVLVAHLVTVNKSKFISKAGIGRRTLYDLLDTTREFNPKLSTVAAILQALANKQTKKAEKLLKLQH